MSCSSRTIDEPFIDSSQAVILSAISGTTRVFNSSSVRVQTSAAIKPPAEVPVTTRGRRPASRNALTTPKWSKGHQFQSCRFAESELTISKTCTTRKCERADSIVGIGTLEQFLFFVNGELRRFANKLKGLFLLIVVCYCSSRLSKKKTKNGTMHTFNEILAAQVCLELVLSKHDSQFCVISYLAIQSEKE